MSANYAMPGFEIRVKDGVLEMRTEGERTQDNGRDTEQAFISLLRHARPKALVFDVRGADYTLSSIAWRERVRSVAKTTRDYPLALIGRSAQMQQCRDIVTAHRQMGGLSDSFTSRRDALRWIASLAQD